MIIIKILAKILSRIIFRIKFYGEKNIVYEGPVIICANHISIWEPIILYLNYPREIIFMSKKELFEKPLLGTLLRKLNMISVDRDKPELSTIKKSLSVLKDDMALGIFPQGTRKKNIDDNDGKAGVGLIAYKSDAPIQPVYFESSYKPFSKVKIVIGEPFYAEKNEKISPKEMYEILGKEIMLKIKELSNESNIS